MSSLERYEELARTSVKTTFSPHKLNNGKVKVMYAQKDGSELVTFVPGDAFEYLRSRYKMSQRFR